MKSNGFSVSLDSSSRKFNCPQCEKKRFVRYLNLLTNEYLPSQVGRCDREQNCGYHFTPRQFFQDNPSGEFASDAHRPVDFLIKKLEQAGSTIPLNLFSASLNSIKPNNFLVWLNHQFGKAVAEKLAEQFKIGTSRKWPGATVFWQIDELGNVCAGKIIQYDSATGKRNKNNFPPVAWVHSEMKLPDFHLNQCLFGLHQLANPQTKHNTICIVEAEKTAVFMSGKMPVHIWLATGGLANLKWETCRPLKNRRVILFPDAGCLEKWKAKLPQLKKVGINASISTLLEEKTSPLDRQNGFDLVDFFIRQNQVSGQA